MSQNLTINLKNISKLTNIFSRIKHQNWGKIILRRNKFSPKEVDINLHHKEKMDIFFFFFNISGIPNSPPTICGI